MPFRDPVVAGVTLVRDAIQSRIYQLGVAGWSINADGSAEFNNATIRGTITAADFRSNNYVPGVAGFDINAITGVAEFNSNVTIRGDLQSGNYVAGTSGYKLTYATGLLEANAATLHGTLEVGTAGGQRVEVVATPFPRLELWSHDLGPPAETLPAFIANLVVTPGQPVLEFDSSDSGSGITTLQIVTPNGASAYGEVFISGTNSTGAGIPATVVQLDNAVLLWLTNTTLASLTSINQALMIGPNTGVNLAASPNRIVVRNNNAASTLHLNPDGGNVNIGGGAAAGTLIVGPVPGANINVNFNQVWALNNGAASGLFLNFSSSGTVQIGNGTAAGADLLCVAMRPTTATAAGPGGTIVGTAYVTSVGLAGSFTVPASGALLVTWQARLTTVGAAGAGAAVQRGLAAMQCQLTNSGGAITHACSDFEAVEVPIPVGVTGNAGIYTLGQTVVVTGLTPNSVAFISLGARLTGTAGTPGPSITLSNSRISAVPMP